MWSEFVVMKDLWEPHNKVTDSADCNLNGLAQANQDRGTQMGPDRWDSACVGGTAEGDQLFCLVKLYSTELHNELKLII